MALLATLAFTQGLSSPAQARNHQEWNQQRPVNNGHREWDRERRFDGRHWGGWDRHVYRGGWFVAGPVYEADPYGTVWVYVWTDDGYVQVQAYYNTGYRRYWYYGPRRTVIWLR
jgi:hypothetical protein